ncbi:hypothetical protein MT378_13180, partial [Psychrobacter sp. 16-Bac2893]
SRISILVGFFVAMLNVLLVGLCLHITKTAYLATRICYELGISIKYLAVKQINQVAKHPAILCHDVCVIG